MKLTGKRVILLIAKGFCDPELWFPYYRFLEEGAEVIIAAPKAERIRGEGDHTMDGWAADVKHTIEDVAELPFDVLFVVGGVYGPMFLRGMESVQKLVRRSVEEGKMTCAVCHGPQVLISADVVRGKKICCPGDMSVDVINAGGIYVKDEAVLDDNILTGINPDSLPDMFRLLMDTI